MAKHNRNNESVENAAPETTSTETAAPVATVNFVLTFRRTHPKDRASYGVDGNSGIVVFDQNLMNGGDSADFKWPATITLDAALVPVKADSKTSKAEIQAAKAAEREAKAKAKLEAAQAKIAEREAKAKAKLEAAQAKLAAAQAAAATPAN